MSVFTNPLEDLDPGKVQWAQAGEKRFQYGVDRGMLYPTGKAGVPWNGLVSVTDGSSRAVKAYYQDGVKFADSETPGEFTGKVSAYTFPDELEEILGHATAVDDSSTLIPGFIVHDQPSEVFGMSYRVLVGNEITQDAGYIIHMLYNLRAVESDIEHKTQDKSVDLQTFSWDLTATPLPLVGARPTAHISVDSRRVAPEVLQELEDILYGTDELTPSLPAFLS